MQINLKDKKFYSTMIGIAIPIALQNLISSSLNMVDTVMIGRLGEKEIAAVGLANQVFFLFILLLFGINSGCAIFTAQFWGKRDILSIRKVLGIALLSGTIISLFFSSAAFFIPQVLLRFFTQDKAVILLGSEYLKIVSFSYFVTAISFSYGFASRSIGQAKLPMVVSGISLLFNTGLNYLLIFGRFGFNPLGIRGAALATLIARSIELLIMLMLIYRNGDVLAGKLKEMLNFNRKFAKTLYRTAMPVILNEGIWSLGMIMYMAAYGRLGTESIAAVQIANTVQNIFMVVAMGLGNSCAVMLGNEIGAGHKENAINYGNAFIALGISCGLLVGILLAILAPFILSFFKVSSIVHDSAYKLLLIMGISLTFKFFNTVLIVGILRSGGDTKFSLFLEMGSVWLFGVPVAFLGVMLWKLPVHWVYALISIEELVKSFIGLPRIISRKWVRNVVENMQ